MLDEAAGAVGYALWRVISDVLLWCESSPDHRDTLWHVDAGQLFTGEEQLPPALTELLQASPFRLEDSARLSAGCAAISGWAEGRGWPETALQFAETAARLDPTSAARCHTAGRLSRRRGEHQRAITWLRRGIRLARRAREHGIDARNEVDFANCHRGYGFVLSDMGDMARAEVHFWKSIRAARRVGHKSLAGAGFHDLLLVAVHQQRWDDALRHAKSAVELYKVGHPRFPLLAHDVAFFWMIRGYFSSARPVVERIMPWVERLREKILVLSTLARCAAAVRDHLHYRRAAQAVLQLAEADPEMAASSLYHLAEGARCFQSWEEAEALARKALEQAHARRNGTIVAWATALLEKLARREPGDYDTHCPTKGAWLMQPAS